MIVWPWQYLDPITRQRGYGNDRSAYLRDAAAADWSALRWTDATVVWVDDGFASVQVGLDSPPSSVPAFLIQHHVVHGVCGAADRPFGLGAYLDVHPFADAQLGGGALAGSTVRCNRAFIGAAPYAER